MPVLAKRMSVLFFCILGLLVFCVGNRGAFAHTQTVSLPITIDYTLLHELIVKNAYTEVNQSVTLLNVGNGCLYLALSKPRLSEKDGRLRFETEVSVHAGTPVGDSCVVPVGWKGYLILYQRPIIDNATWQLSFVTTGSELLDTNRHPARMAGVLWDLIKGRVFRYLEGIRIDLAPPVEELKTFLLPLFPPNVQEQTKAMLAGLRTGETQITPNAIIVHAVADVHEVYQPEQSETRTKEVLSGEELQEVLGDWEQSDALLSYLVATMSKDVLTESERQSLVDVFLETRYRFIEGLNDNNLTHDFVRKQFVNAWKQLAPIFRRHLEQNKQSDPLGYLAFFSSADALSVLDRLGPTFGIEISREGLIRLARMLTSDPAALTYGTAVNPDLRKLFRLRPALQVDKVTPSEKPSRPESAPIPTPQPQNRHDLMPGARQNNIPVVPEGREIKKKSADWPSLEHKRFHGRGKDLQDGQGGLSLHFGLASRFKDFFLTPAWAGETSTDDILRWRVPKTDVDGYIKRVIEVLDGAIAGRVQQDGFPHSLQRMYRHLIIAMAWQESCFRQFIVKNHQLIYLLSYNNSSVGLMQVNERVWRGLYDLERLRWDIYYNAAAGSEIADLYLQKYALQNKKVAAKMDRSTLARLVYAMYNGGPGQYREFLRRLKKGKMPTIDKLFKKKYTLVAADKWGEMSRCLSGE